MSEWCDGKSVFITGASAGIGAELARAFARRGARVAATARRKDRLDALAREIETSGGRAIALAGDVTDRTSLDLAVQATAQAFGGIDVAVANAGFGVSGQFTALTTEDYRRQFDTNVFGVIDTIYAVLPHLRESRGRLGIVSSIMGRIGAPTSSAYCSSKFALCGLAESLYYEFGEQGVSVACIEPGVVASDFRITDNRAVVNEADTDPAPTWLIVPTERAAHDIIRALGKRKFEAVITGHGKVLTFLTRHFPRTCRWAGRHATRGKLERIEQHKRAHPTSGR